MLASGTLPDERRDNFSSIFEILFGFMGPFSAPRVIADHSQIVLLIIDGHFDPRKNASGRGSKKNSLSKLHVGNLGLTNKILCIHLTGI